MTSALGSLFPTEIQIQVCPMQMPLAKMYARTARKLGAGILQETWLCRRGGGGGITECVTKSQCDMHGNGGDMVAY